MPCVTRRFDQVCHLMDDDKFQALHAPDEDLLDPYAQHRRRIRTGTAALT